MQKNRKGNTIENLFDRAGRMDPNILGTQIAEMQTLRIPVYLSILFSNLCAGILRLAAQINPKLQKTAEKHAKTSFSERLRMAEIRIRKQGDTSEAFYETVRNCVRSVSLFALVGVKNEDALSAKITHYAAGVLPASEIRGKSVYETNERIYRRYADRKKMQPLTYLRLWLVFVLLLCFMIPLLCGLQVLPLLVGAILLPVLLFFITIGISGRMAVWHLAKLVWLLMSETGNTGIPTEKEDAYSDLLKLRMRTLHTLVYSSGVLHEKEKKIKERIDEYEDRMAGNNDRIASGTKDGGAEEERILAGKKEENAQLKEKISSAKEKVTQTVAEYGKIDATIRLLLDDLVPQFAGKWSAAYRRLLLPSGIQKQILCGFSLEEIAVIEKRFFEIDNTSDPTAIAKKKGGINRIPFTTGSEGMAQIGFEDPDPSGARKICLITRADRLSEPFVTETEMREALKGLEKSRKENIPDTDIHKYVELIRELRKSLEEENRKWTVERSVLIRKNEDLEADKERLGREICQKEQHIDRIYADLDEKNGECEALREQIRQQQEEGNGEKVRELEEALKVSEQEREKLQKECDKRMGEMEALYQQIHNLNEKQVQLRQELAENEKELEKANGILNNCLTELRLSEEQIEELNRKNTDLENQIVTMNGLLKKADGKREVDQETIRKLKNSKSRLENDKKELEAKIEGKKQEVKELKEQIRTLHVGVDTRKKEVAELVSRIEKSKNKILYSDQIYEELYRWIEAAQEYVYIVSAFVSYPQMKKMEEKFLSALRSNPDLRIRILWGMQDEWGDREKFKKAEKNIEILTMDMEKAGKKSQFAARPTNTHVKLVIVDDRKYMIGSANVMSFSYDDDYQGGEDVHSEICICSEDREGVKELKEKYFHW